jgi:hypothetical protein
MSNFLSLSFLLLVALVFLTHLSDSSKAALLQKGGWNAGWAAPAPAPALAKTVGKGKAPPAQKGKTKTPPSPPVAPAPAPPVPAPAPAPPPAPATTQNHKVTTLRPTTHKPTTTAVHKQTTTVTPSVTPTVTQSLTPPSGQGSLCFCPCAAPTFPPTETFTDSSGLGFFDSSTFTFTTEVPSSPSPPTNQYYP